MEGVVHLGCWAHLRRKFDEAVKALPKGDKTGAAVTGQAYCTKLFLIERELQGLAPERRYEERLKREKPLLDEFRAWADARTVAPKSKLGQAFVYLKNQWTPLTNYLLDGRLEISNNRAERSIKPFVMGRKNFLFANTPRGARASRRDLQRHGDGEGERARPLPLPAPPVGRTAERGQAPRRLAGAVPSVERAGRLPHDARIKSFSRANLMGCAAGRYIFTRCLSPDSL